MLVLDKDSRVRLSIENASILTGSPEEVSDGPKMSSTNTLIVIRNLPRRFAHLIHKVDGLFESYSSRAYFRGGAR